MKKSYWLSIAIVISSICVYPAGNVVLSVSAGAHQLKGEYKECYGSGSFNFGGSIGYEALVFYRSKIVIEAAADFEKSSEEVEIEHIAGTYTYERSIKRTGYNLSIRYQYDFTKDGVSLAIGYQKDFERENVDGTVVKYEAWRPTASVVYELNLGKQNRLFLGARAKFNVNGGVEPGIYAGLKMSFNFFRKFEG